VAGTGSAEEESMTCMLDACPTTWAFVTMSPLESKTTPDPSPELVRISTTDGRTCLMAAVNASCNEA
jgi:hypothetical protein